MSMIFNEFQTATQVGLFPIIAVPLATEVDFDNPHPFPTVDLYQFSDSDNYAYQNAETCPDCTGGMIRQGRCCTCPSCGFESCLV